MPWKQFVSFSVSRDDGDDILIDLILRRPVTFPQTQEILPFFTTLSASYSRGSEIHEILRYAMHVTINFFKFICSELENDGRCQAGTVWKLSGRSTRPSISFTAELTSHVARRAKSAMGDAQCTDKMVIYGASIVRPSTATLR